MRSHRVSLISTFICILIRQKDEKPAALTSGHLDHSNYAARNLSGGRIPEPDRADTLLYTLSVCHIHTLIVFR